MKTKITSKTFIVQGYGQRLKRWVDWQGCRELDVATRLLNWYPGRPECLGYGPWRIVRRTTVETFTVVAERPADAVSSAACPADPRLAISPNSGSSLRRSTGSGRRS